MRNLYIVIAVLFVLSVLLLVGAFFYLDKMTHKTYYYIVESQARPCGSVKVDRFSTEDNLIYKSDTLTPFEPGLKKREVKLSLTNRYILDEYRDEGSGQGSKEFTVIENIDGKYSFLATYESRFSYLEGMPVKKTSFLFKDDELATYLPLIENYDFRRGRSQGFNALVLFDRRLPPRKALLTLTSIKDEYIPVDSRKVKCECLLLKMRSYPQITVWVAKHDRSVVMAELPHKQARFLRSLSYKKFEAEKRALPESPAYFSREVSFKNKKTDLSGTLTVPRQKEPSIPVILIPDSRPLDRNCAGIFADLADRLSRNGFATLRFDKRGLGASSGDFDSYSDEDELSDAKAAIDLLSAQNEVDANKVMLLGYSKGGYFVSKIASEDARVMGCVIMAGLAYINEEASDFRSLRQRAARENWSEEYLKAVIKSRLENSNIVKVSGRDWRSFLGKRCYLKKMREEAGEDPIAAIRAVKVPALLLCGAKDIDVPPEYSKILDKNLEEAGNTAHRLINFGYLDHNFGIAVFDGRCPVRYEVDEQVTKVLVDWLKEITAPKEGVS